jgi:glycerol uptake facilitator-like aquaporin
MVIPKYVIEFIGTFMLICIILNTDNQALPVSVALATIIYFGGLYGSNHYNPAVTFVSWNNGTISTEDAGTHVIAQLLGGYAAYWFYINTNVKKAPS